MKIAILDDGIATCDLYINCDSQWQISNQMTIPTAIPSPSDSTYTHGTICAAIIQKYAPAAQLISLKVLPANAAGSAKQLLAAMQWCLDQDIQVLNLSLGTTSPPDYVEIARMAHRLADHNRIIVAAQNNNNQYTVPASLDCVIGVKKRSLYSDSQYMVTWYPLDGIEVLASARHHLRRKDGSDFTTEICNSFAAPLITAQIANLLDSGVPPSKTELLQRLASGAVRVEGCYIPQFDPYCSLHGASSPQLWTMELYEQTVRNSLLEPVGEISAPLLSLRTDSVSTLIALEEQLNRAFRDALYYPLTLLVAPSIPLHNPYFILPQTLSRRAFCYTVDRIYQPDVILIQDVEGFEADLRLEWVDSQLRIYDPEGNRLTVYPQDKIDSFLQDILARLT